MSKLSCLTVGILLLGSSGVSKAQSQQPRAQNAGDAYGSLAAAALDAKAKKAHSKKVFSDDDMETTAGPFPRLKMDGAENADDIVVAISKYKANHTSEETEQAVHIWFDR